MSGHFRSSAHFSSISSPTAQPPHHCAKQAKIVTACIFSTFAVLILLALCYVRRYWRRRNERANRVNNAVASTRTTASTPCSPEVLASLPIFVYSVEDEKRKPLSECAVCLGEFTEGEKGRNLPRCGHSFHVECIDTWLDSHVTCPLCRVSVGDPEAAPSESLDSVV